MTMTQLVGGLAGVIGSQFRTAQNRLYIVENGGGKLSRLDLFPTMSVVSSGSTTLKGTYLFDFDAGTQGGSGPAMDVFWDQATAVVRHMDPANGAGIINLGKIAFGSVLPQALPGLAYGATPIDGNNDATNKLVTGDVFAVRTTAGHFAKVLVTSYGYDIGIQWITYAAATGYAVLGTGYQQPEDVKISADGQHAYVTERAGNLLKVPLASANRSNASVVASGMTAPQQFSLDEPNGFAYVIENAAAGRLLRINLANGTPTTLLNGLSFAVGLVLSADGQSAYVAEQTANSTAGRVSQFSLQHGQPKVLAGGLNQPGFLTWLDAAQTTLVVPESDPVDDLRTIDASTGKNNVIASGLPSKPASIAVVSPGVVLACCGQVIEELDLAAVVVPGAPPLLQSIGFVPFNWLTAAGLADTTSHDPAYLYQVSNAPFAGTLPVMVNFLEASAEGAAYYQVKVDGSSPRTDTFPGAIWNGTAYVGATFGTQVVNGQPGFYPVLSPAELELWIQPVPGCYLDSTSLASGTTHQIKVEFFDANGNAMPSLSAQSPNFYVDNNPCRASISLPTLNNVAANSCGYLAYPSAALVPATAPQYTVSVAFTASQPQGYASYSLSVIRGVLGIAGQGGSLPAPTSFSTTVATLIQTCPIAGFAASIYVASSATTGWVRAGGLDASAAVAFVLAPG